MLSPEDFDVIRSRRKTVALELKPGARPVLRIPASMSGCGLLRFIREHEAWLAGRIRRAEARKAARPAAARLTAAEYEALLARGKRLFPERVRLYASVAGVDYGRISVRCQKTRWGSCSAAGNLSFNVLLLLAPPEVLDYVVAHELCHRLEMNHSARFYAQLQRVFPAYREARAWLKTNGETLLARAPGPA